MESIRPPDHRPLRTRPVLLVRQRTDAQPFSQRRQEAVFGLGVPRRRSIAKFQLRSASTRFFLLAGQPVPQRMHEIVVRQLVEAGGGSRVEGGGRWGGQGWSLCSKALRKPLSMRLIPSVMARSRSSSSGLSNPIR